MKITFNLFLFLGLVATVLAQALDNRYIVMLKRVGSPTTIHLFPSPEAASPSLIQTRAHTSQDSDIDAYLAKISAVGDVEEILRWHGASIFYGVVVRSLEHDLESLGAYPEVESVEVDQIITIPGCPVEPCTITDELEEKDRRASLMAVEWNA